MDFRQLILPTLEHFHAVGYWLALLAALSETTIGIGLIIPGSTAVLFMGALAAKGYFDLGDLIWFAALGAIIGDNINYFIGRKYGAKIFKNGFWFIQPAHFKKGEDFFAKHGAKSVFVGRFVPSIKEVIPLVAGLFEMKHLPFMLWNILGAIGWALAWILPGYFFAQSLKIAEMWLTRTGFFLTVLVAFFVVFYILKAFFVKKGRDFFIFLSSVWQSVKQAVSENPEVKKFSQQHQKIFIFLRKRLAKNKFSGLPLTLLSLALFYTLGLFGGIIEDIIRSDVIVSVDTRVANLLTIFRSPELTKIFFWLTLLGKWQVILIFLAATLAGLWLWRRQTYMIPLMLSIVGSEVFTFASKIIFHRPRPQTAIYTEHSFSFPSGHATIAVAFYGFLAYILIRNAKSWKFKINVFFASFITVLIIGLSRLYLGVHYLSDVWGGYLVGAIWLIIAIGLSEYLLFKKQKNRISPSGSQKKRLATAIIIAVAVLFYIIFAQRYQPPGLKPPPRTGKTVVNNVMSIFNSEQLKYTETLLGRKQEPLSFIIVAKNDRQLIDLFKKAGWELADNVSIASIYRIAKAALAQQSYPRAPMTPDFWHSAVHNFGFEQETAANNVRTRHHARFWKTNYITNTGENIYVGTASFDSGIKWGVTHKIKPDIDTEREFLFKSLQATGWLMSSKKVPFVKPSLGSNFSGDLFFTDGQLYLLFVKE